MMSPRMVRWHVMVVFLGIVVLSVLLSVKQATQGDPLALLVQIFVGLPSGIFLWKTAARHCSKEQGQF